MKKIKAGALQYSIAFSLLIMVILSLFLMHVHLQSIEVLQAQKQIQLIENIQAGVTILENSPSAFNQFSFEINIDEKTNNQIKIEITPWGFYDIALISSSHMQMNLSKMFLFSDNIRKNKILPSLYLSDSKRYLSIAGKTYLGTNTYLPAYGIRKAYVGGIGYTRDKLIYGESLKAANILPVINTKWNRRYLQLTRLTNESTNKMTLKELKKDSITNSFSSPTLIIQCSPTNTISNYYFSGNIILTGSKITLGQTTQLHKCIVLADTILTNGNFTGEVQFFAANKIEIGTGSVLKVPTILFLNNKKESDQIILQSSVELQGDIIIPNEKGKNESLMIESNCHLLGQIYCNGYSSCAGTIFGSFYTRGFINRTPKGLYENYLVDVCIDIERLPKEYNGISIIEDPKAKSCNEELF